jgi:hypothetical protein
MNTHATSAPMLRERRDRLAKMDRAEKQEARRHKQAEPTADLTVHVNQNGYDFTIESSPSGFLCRGNIEYDSMIRGHQDPSISWQARGRVSIEQAHEFMDAMTEAIALATGEHTHPDLEDSLA